RRQAHREARRRQLAVLIVIAVVALAMLLVTAFGGSDHPAVGGALSAPASATRLLPAGPPKPQVIARVGTLALQLPVNRTRVTAIGYAAGSNGALALSPVGGQANEGLLKRLFHAVIGGGGGSPRWYLLPGGSGPTTSALDVGAPSGTDAYAPVDGTIVGIENVILNGKRHGQRIDI